MAYKLFRRVHDAPRFAPLASFRNYAVSIRAIRLAFSRPAQQFEHAFLRCVESSAARSNSFPVETTQGGNYPLRGRVLQGCSYNFPGILGSLSRV